MKKLTIIIPVYNTEDYLQNCFNSIVELTSELVSLEIIFVNDGSTDNSLDIITALEHHYDFVKVVTQSNQGLSAARNTGIENATGDYFLLLDSDDWLSMDIIYKIFKIAESQNLDLVGFRLQFVNENKIITGSSVKHSLNYEKVISGPKALIDGYQPSSACLFLYKTSFIKKNHLTFFKGIMQEDVEFTVRLLLNAKTVLFTDLIGYNYYRRADSMTTAVSKSRVEHYLNDSIIVAEQIKRNVDATFSVVLIEALEKNYNSVVWNLLWRFYSKPKEVDYDFKIKCLKELKEKELYPIKGALKTNFQKISCFFFNQEWLLKLIFKIKT